MSETQAAEAAGKSKTVYTTVKMTDGRKVNFPGKRKVQKETLIDESKIVVDGSVVQLEEGAVSIRMDFLNGETRTMMLPLAMLAKFAGHGAEQKFGDELATTADKPLSEDDMVIAIDELNAQIQAGKWGAGRAEGGGGVSGAGIVLQAILEASNEGRAEAGKPLNTIADIKAYIQRILDKELSKPEAERLTKRALYNSFRVAGTKTGIIIARLEAAKLAKEAKVDANAALAEINA
jgi:hypothetical protein